MPKILITNNYDHSVKSIIEKQKPEGFELVYLKTPGKESLLEVCNQVDYFLVGGRLPIDSEVLMKASGLKMIQRTGVGLDQVDLEYLKKKGIPLYVNKGVNAISVAEHTLMLMLATLKKLHIADTLLKSGVWKKQSLGVQTFELHGKTIGLIGLGNIGITVAKLLQPFGVQVLYYKRNRLNQEDEDLYNVEYSDLENLFKKSDIVSLHCSFNGNTKEIVNSNSIQLMKDGVFVINTSRGKLINQQALIEALKSKKIAAAGLDVFEEEPLRADNEILTLKNVVLTPHISGITNESFSNMYKRAFQNIVSFEKNELDKIENYKVC